MSSPLAGFLRPCRGPFRPVLSPLVLVRGKKKVAKKQKKTKKDLQREAMKEQMKRLELEKQAQEAVMKVAKQGEPLDPEMLNPARKRPLQKLSGEEQEREFLLVKEWSRYCMERHKQDLRKLQEMVDSRRRALNELKKISYPLYIKALETRNDLFPFERVGPTFTPPIEGYQPPELEES